MEIDNEVQRANAGQAGPINTDAEDGRNQMRVSGVRGRESGTGDGDESHNKSASSAGKARRRSETAKWIGPVQVKGDTAVGHKNGDRGDVDPAERDAAPRLYGQLLGQAVDEHLHQQVDEKAAHSLGGSVGWGTYVSSPTDEEKAEKKTLPSHTHATYPKTLVSPHCSTKRPSN